VQSRLVPCGRSGEPAQSRTAAENPQPSTTSGVTPHLAPATTCQRHCYFYISPPDKAVPDFFLTFVNTVDNSQHWMQNLAFRDTRQIWNMPLRKQESLRW